MWNVVFIAQCIVQVRLLQLSDNRIMAAPPQSSPASGCSDSNTKPQHSQHYTQTLCTTLSKVLTKGSVPIARRRKNYRFKSLSLLQLPYLNPYKTILKLLGSFTVLTVVTVGTVGTVVTFETEYSCQQWQQLKKTTTFILGQQ